MREKYILPISRALLLTSSISFISQFIAMVSVSIITQSEDFGSWVFVWLLTSLSMLFLCIVFAIMGVFKRTVEYLKDWIINGEK